LVVKPAQLQQSGFSCGKTSCNSSVPVSTLTRNRSSRLELFLTLVVIPRKYKDLHGWADCVDRFIQVVRQSNKMHIVSVGAIVVPGHLAQEYAAADDIDSVLLVNNHVDLDTYWTVY